MGGEGSPAPPPRTLLLDRLRNIAPRGLKARIYDRLVGSNLIGALARDAEGIVTSNGLRFDVSGGHEHRAAAIRLGLYERAERYMATTFYTGERDVVELGASLGVISCELARKRRPGVRQVIVEADPQLAQRARRNLALNGFDDVIVEQCAIDYSGAGTVRFSGGQGLAGQVDRGGDIEVPAVTLSQLLDRHGIADFDLVMDIEGAEDAVLAQDPEALWRCARILVECDAGQLEDGAVPPLFAERSFRMIYRHEACAAFERVR